MTRSTWYRDKFVLLFALGFIALQLVGCATPAKVSNMTAHVDHSLQAAPPSPYFNNISILPVTGGSETHPLWTSQVASEDFQSALESTLSSAKLLGSPEDAQYQLAATILALDQPLIGFNMTVDMTVDYLLKDKRTGKIVFGEKINSSYTGTMGDAFVGTTRLRITNEGAVRQNFDLFLKKLLKM
ncbi:MAG TPA: hypothetical protein VMW10_06360 [Alphaproteobacteria bacterium]|nr:hypothetical protein [Alphaproteobacteria bacterium]